MTRLAGVTRVTTSYGDSAVNRTPRRFSPTIDLGVENRCAGAVTAASRRFEPEGPPQFAVDLLTANCRGRGARRDGESALGLPLVGDRGGEVIGSVVKCTVTVTLIRCVVLLSVPYGIRIGFIPIAEAIH